MHARLASADLILQIEDDRVAHDEQSQFKIFLRNQAAFVQLREEQDFRSAFSSVDPLVMVKRS